MAGYCCVVIGSAWILRLVCRRPQVLCCIIPFLVIGSLVFCLFLWMQGGSFRDWTRWAAVSAVVLSAGIQVI